MSAEARNVLFVAGLKRLFVSEHHFLLRVAVSQLLGHQQRSRWQTHAFRSLAGEFDDDWYVFFEAPPLFARLGVPTRSKKEGDASGKLFFNLGSSFAILELLNAACGIKHLLIAGIDGVALAADFDR